MRASEIAGEILTRSEGPLGWIWWAARDSNLSRLASVWARRRNP